MIHVPDVRAAVAWYAAIGCDVLETYDDGRSGLSFAILGIGATRLMLNQGGKSSAERRREVDLYIDAEDVDRLHTDLREHVEIVDPPHDTHYGMRELIVRDLNRFWITFGQPLSRESSEDE
jgi:hypothetical protein